MSDSVELLLLRLGLLAIIFAFVLVAALAMRAGLAPRASRAVSAPAPVARRLATGPRLVVISPASTGLAPGTEFSLAGEMSLGRDPSNGIVLGDSSVSGRHAVIERTARGWRIADLGSTNGTLVNGRPLNGRAAILRGGEQVTLGAVVLRFQP